MRRYVNQTDQTQLAGPTSDANGIQLRALAKVPADPDVARMSKLLIDEH
jgi:hypothetical protein